jgi:DNA-binding response OmpR family regulator
MNEGSKTILVVDDERSIADTMAAIFRLAGYRSHAVYSAAEALEALPAADPALIIADVIMPGMDGVEFAIRARALRPATAIALISGNAGTLEIVERARRRGHAFEVLAKPVPPRELLARVAAMLGRTASPAAESSSASA